MKRLISILLVLSMLLVAIACAKSEPAPTDPASQETAAQTGTEEQGTGENGTGEPATGEQPDADPSSSTTTKKPSTTTKRPTTTTKPPVTTTKPSTSIPSAGYGSQQTYTPQIIQNFSWSNINALPQATASMSVEKLRDICWDFMALQLNFGWKANASFKAKEGKNVTYKTNTLYGGMPYSESTFNNLYQVMHYYKDGVMDINAMSAASNGDVKSVFGNQCSASTLWSWARVSNTVGWTSTATVTPYYGAIPLGDALYDYFAKNYPNLDKYTESVTSKTVLHGAGKEAAFAGYDKLQKGDGLVYNAGAGHVMMVHHVDTAAKKIYIQHQTYRNAAAGAHTGDYDSMTYEQAYNDGSVPFTIPEFLPKTHPKYSPVENYELFFSHQNATVTVDQLKNAYVKSNYMISDVTIRFKHGNTVLEEVFVAISDGVRYTGQIKRKAPLYINNGGSNAERNLGVDLATLNNHAANGNTIEISARISTGFEKVVYTGTLST
ncbi:MAG: hypothetical protein IJC84_04925 [Clostridia bacterium]|nr:hypothetical protein [Clostridia bacterium]